MDLFFIWYLIPTLFITLFTGAFKRNRAGLAAGMFLTAAVVSLSVIFFMHAYYSDSRIMKTVSVIPLSLAFLLVTIGAYALILFLILNTRKILKREKGGLQHILTLFLAVLLTVLLVLPQYTEILELPRVVVYFIYSAYGVCVYYLFNLAQYIISVVLCNISRPPLNQDFIMVLGCWIKDGQVTPILARRLDKAFEFYLKQKKAGYPSKLVFSGGKGSDEICSEAFAMKDYALSKDIPERHILIEDKSVSTYENMLFSKKIMDEHANGKPYNCVFVTSNYHVLRAGIYARKVGLTNTGIGAKTAFYYLPNALLREYIAYIFIHIKLNVAFIGSALVLGCVALSRLEWLFAG